MWTHLPTHWPPRSHWSFPLAAFNVWPIVLPPIRAAKKKYKLPCVPIYPGSFHLLVVHTIFLPLFPSPFDYTKYRSIRLSIIRSNFTKLKLRIIRSIFKWMGTKVLISIFWPSLHGKGFLKLRKGMSLWCKLVLYLVHIFSVELCVNCRCIGDTWCSSHMSIMQNIILLHCIKKWTLCINLHYLSRTRM